MHAFLPLGPCIANYETEASQTAWKKWSVGSAYAGLMVLLSYKVKKNREWSRCHVHHRRGSEGHLQACALSQALIVPKYRVSTTLGYATAGFETVHRSQSADINSAEDAGPIFQETPSILAKRTPKIPSIPLQDPSDSARTHPSAWLNGVKGVITSRQLSIPTWPAIPKADLTGETSAFILSTSSSLQKSKSQRRCNSWYRRQHWPWSLRIESSATRYSGALRATRSTAGDRTDQGSANGYRGNSAWFSHAAAGQGA